MRKAPHNSAFTIIEVLISIAIALLLILGINQVFSIAQQTSGAGTTALGQVEAARGAQAVFQTDFNNAVTGPDSPGIVIVSEPVYAYRNRQDLLSNRSTAANAVQFINDPVNTNNSTGIQQSLTATNSRVHRIDRIMFFTRGTAPRQTSDAPGLTSPTAWLESFVWFGHLALPRNYQYNQQHQPYSGPIPNYPNPFTSGDFRNPGDPGTNPQAATTYNPNNYFASDWVLGRMPIVLVPFATPNSAGTAETTMAAPTVGSTPLTIMAVNNTSPAQAFQETAQGQLTAVTPVWPLYSSRYDMAFTSIDGMRQALANIPTTNNFSRPAWWQHLSGVVVQPPGNFPFDVRYEADSLPLRPPQQPTPPTQQQLGQWASAVAARQAPMFLRGCSQFIVEFAGDFITQDNNPNSVNFGKPVLNGAQPDGEIDFTVSVLPSGEKVKRIRWYGFPRDIGSPPTPNAPQPAGTPDGHITWQDDVVPVRDVSNQINGGPYPFERWVNTTLPQRNDYAFPVNQVQVGSQYICAWGWDTPNVLRPKMIRITIALDDPSGRLNGEQYFEYVFNLP